MTDPRTQEVTESGQVYALDPDRDSIAALARETRHTNIETLEGDITKPTTLDQSSVDLMYLSTVIHGFSKEQMRDFVAETTRILKPGGLLAIVEINKGETGFGPPLSMRVSPEDLKETVPLAPVDTIPVGEHFYLQMFRNEQPHEV